MNDPAHPEFDRTLRRLLREATGRDDAYAVTPLPGGRNNRVFRVATTAAAFLLKAYFSHPNDPRDRLEQEFGFLRYLAQRGCRLVPAPLASDPPSRLGLMEFVGGTRPSLEEIALADIDQAAELYRQANAEPRQPGAASLRPASEACFSIAEHLEKTQRRVDRLSQIVVQDEIDAAAAGFAREELIPIGAEVRASVLREWPAESERTALLPEAERCLSPSDFGFHNSLREAGGRLRFVDFEYAGWDDPAKLIADFANQPDMLLARPLSDRFRAAALAIHPHPDALARRVTWLEPLYQVKWACICLNDFLDAGHTRRRFTDGETSDHRTRRTRQLARARLMLERVRRAPAPLTSSS
jgi:hypothetical protein